MMLSKFIPLVMMLPAMMAMAVDATKSLSPSLFDSRTKIRMTNSVDACDTETVGTTEKRKRRIKNHRLLFSKKQSLCSIRGGDDGTPDATVKTIFSKSETLLLDTLGLATACVGAFHAGVTTFWPSCKLPMKNNTKMDETSSSAVHPIVTYFTRATGAIRTFYVVMVVGTVYGSNMLRSSSITTPQTVGLALIPLLVFYMWSIVTHQPRLLKIPLWSLLLNMGIDGFFCNIFLTSSANPQNKYPRFLQYSNNNITMDIWMKVFGYWNIMLGLLLIMATDFSMNIWGLLSANSNNDNEDGIHARKELKSVLRTKLGVHALLSGLFLLVLSEYNGVKGDLVMAFIVFLIP